MYYDMLWDVGFRWSNEVLNHGAWPTRVNPIESLSGIPPSDPDRHVFGAYTLFRVPDELALGKWSPRSEMGIWVGVDRDAPHSHLVCPIKWMVDTQSWDILPPIGAARVKVYDDVFPLRMSPRSREFGSQKFDTFVDSIFNPLLYVMDSPEYSVGEPSLSSDATTDPPLRRSK